MSIEKSSPYSNNEHIVWLFLGLLFGVVVMLISCSVIVNGSYSFSNKTLIKEGIASYNTKTGKIELITTSTQTKTIKTKGRVE